MGILLAFTFGVVAGYCGESPAPAPASGGSVSHGAPSHGGVDAAVRFVDGAHARVMPLRHKARCLSWGTDRLVVAIARAADAVAARLPGGAPLGVGNIGRARGGPILDYSRSHNAGRDADLAFYVVDDHNHAVAADDLIRLDAHLRGTTHDGKRVRLDVPRTWALARALLEDPTIDVEWLFVAPPIRAALLDEGKREAAPAALLARAATVLHQPSDAPPHDDHVHLRIRCTTSERQRDCRD